MKAKNSIAKNNIINKYNIIGYPSSSNELTFFANQINKDCNYLEI